LGERGFPRAALGARPSPHVRGVLAREHLRPGARVRVVTRRVRQEPLGWLVVVLVDEVRPQLAELRPEEVEPLAVRARARAADEPDLRMPCLQHAREPLVALDVLRSPLLVADADVLQAERLGMP